MLHKYADSVCIPTDLRTPRQRPTDQAVLIVGEAPGANEDEQDKNFVGQSGRELESFYIHGPALQLFADVYTGNAVRCHPVGNDTPGTTVIQSCQHYLIDDIKILSARYRKVILILTGATAVRSVLGTSLTDAMRRQSQRLPDFANVYVFTTYHPAYLMRVRAKEGTIQRHLELVQEFLSKGSLKMERMPACETSPRPAPGWSGPLAFDFETFGIMKCRERQTQFHPRKMLLADGMPYANQLVCASIAWRDKTSRLRLGYFDMGNPTHRQAFLLWFRQASEVRGQNLAFDVKEGRAIFGWEFIPTWFFMRDLMMEAFVYDGELDRGLKALAPLLRITMYLDDRKPVRIFSIRNTKKCRIYVCRDSFAAYRGIEKLDGMMKDRYAKHPVASSKLTAFRRRWFSDLLWLVIRKEENGICLDRTALKKIHYEKMKQSNKLQAEVLRDYGLLTRGKGSDGSKRSFFAAALKAARRYALLRAKKLGRSNALEEYKAMREALEMTKSKGPSVNAVNRNLVLGSLNPEDYTTRRYYLGLTLFGEIESLEKIVSSYTRPLLFGKKKEVPRKHIAIVKSGKRKGLPRLIKDPLRCGVRRERASLAFPFKELVNYDDRFQIDPTKTLHRPEDRVLADRRADGGRGHARRTRYPFLFGSSLTTSVPSQSLSSRLHFYERLGFAYSTIFAVPKESDERGKGGGTSSYRWAEKDPAGQTFPNLISQCCTTRYVPGYYIIWDGKQLEWRVQMGIAGDIAGLAEIKKGIDVHRRSAEFILGPAMLETPDWINSSYGKRVLTTCPQSDVRDKARLYYRVSRGREERDKFVEIVQKWGRQNGGKSQGFAWLYGGSGPVIHRTTRLKCGMDVGEAKGYAFIDWLNGIYKQVFTFRENSLKSVCRDKAVHLPGFGQSRIFGGEEEDIYGYLQRPAIFDMPVQCIAATIVQAVMRRVVKRLDREKLPAIVSAYVHDSLGVEIHHSVAQQVCDILHWGFSGSSYLRKVEEHYGHKIPLEYEAKIVASPGIAEGTKLRCGKGVLCVEAKEKKGKAA